MENSKLTCTYCNKPLPEKKPERKWYLVDVDVLLFGHLAHWDCHSKALKVGKAPYRRESHITKYGASTLAKVDRQIKAGKFKFTKVQVTWSNK